MNPTALPLIDPTFLFHFRTRLYRLEKHVRFDSLSLPAEAKLPCFGELGGQKLFADVRGGWNEAGLGFTLRVAGKRQPPWCRESRPEDCDGLHLWIDTRDTHNIHRASRFCHRFLFCSQGAGKAGIDPFAKMLPINRAKEDSRTLGPQAGLEVSATHQLDGYEVSAWIPTDALSGFSLEEHPRLGFYYAVVDREMGWQTWNLGPEFPITEDPSLWGTVLLD